LLTTVARRKSRSPASVSFSGASSVGRTRATAIREVPSWTAAYARPDLART
jgi:hypothetical protein